MIAFANDFWGWAKHLSGTDNGGGLWYLWWSGFFANATIFAAVLIFIRHKNCHVKGCWRIGHPDPKHGHPTCRPHSPHFDAHGRPKLPVEILTSTQFTETLQKPHEELRPSAGLVKQKPSAPPADPSNRPRKKRPDPGNPRNH